MKMLGGKENLKPISVHLRFSGLTVGLRQRSGVVN